MKGPQKAKVAKKTYLGIADIVRITGISYARLGIAIRSGRIVPSVRIGNVVGFEEADVERIRVFFTSRNWE